ncbi:MAG: metal-dependent hydrolase [Candidatus Saccharimonadales bacterium]
MTARTHDLAAITALGIVVLAQPAQSATIGTVIIALVANQLGGIAPDIDQPTAPFWRNLPIGKLFGKFTDKLLGGHRFLTHSALGVTLFGFLAFWLLKFLHPIMPDIDQHLVLLAFMIGMISHLIMDTFTKEGVPWLLPIPIKFGLPPIKAFRVTTGKLGEKIIFLTILLVDVLYCTSHYQQLRLLLHQRII